MSLLHRLRAALLLAAIATPAYSQSCDRTCLTGFVTRYLDAMVAHDPAKVPFDAKARFTENSAELKIGEGLWKTATALRPYRQDIVDTRQGIAASLVIAEEGGNPVMLGLRLKVANQKITEVETLVTRSRQEGAIFNIDGLKAPRGGLLAPVAAAQRNTREDLIRIANHYPEGLTIGSFVENDSPFAKDTYRLENGSTMAGPGCTRAGCEDIKAQSIIKHPGLKSQVMAVDEDLGVVLIWMNFGDTGNYGAGNALVVFEAFKVYSGQIHAVEAFMRVLPASTTRNWN